MSERLPYDSICGDVSPRCPWCHQDCGEAPLTLDGLMTAWCDGDHLAARPDRSALGEPEEGALTGECPYCARPFMIALQKDIGGRHVRLLAIRTPSDIALIRRGGA